MRSKSYRLDSVDAVDRRRVVTAADFAVVPRAGHSAPWRRAVPVVVVARSTPALRAELGGEERVVDAHRGADLRAAEPVR